MAMLLCPVKPWESAGGLAVGCDVCDRDGVSAVRALAAGAEPAAEDVAVRAPLFAEVALAADRALVDAGGALPGGRLTRPPDDVLPVSENRPKWEVHVPVPQHPTAQPTTRPTAQSPRDHSAQSVVALDLLREAASGLRSNGLTLAGPRPACRAGLLRPVDRMSQTTYRPDTPRRRQDPRLGPRPNRGRPAWRHPEQPGAPQPADLR